MGCPPSVRCWVCPNGRERAAIEAVARPRHLTQSYPVPTHLLLREIIVRPVIAEERPRLSYCRKSMGAPGATDGCIYDDAIFLVSPPSSAPKTAIPTRAGESPASDLVRARARPFNGPNWKNVTIPFVLMEGTAA